MLPTAYPDIDSAETSESTKDEGKTGNITETLLDHSPPNMIPSTLYPVLVPNTPLPSMESMDDPKEQPTILTHDKDQASELVTTSDSQFSRTTKVRYSRNQRYQDLQQVTTNPLKYLSPIHEERFDEEELIKSAPLFAVDDNQLEPLTTTLSNLSTMSNGSMSYTGPYWQSDALQTNPLRISQYCAPQQSTPIFTKPTKPLKPFVNQSSKQRDGLYIMAPNQPSNLSPAKMSYRYPVYTRFSSSDGDIPAGRAIDSLLAQRTHFSYNQPYILTNCGLRTCNKSTQSTDISTCICPRCGPFSVVRYCSIAHLRADIRRHYTEDCLRRPNMLALIAIGTLEPFNRPLRAFIPVTRADDDSLERHRQAVHWSHPTDPNVDYSVFDDADLLLAGEKEGFIPSSAVMRKYRGHGTVVATVAMRRASVVKGQFALTLEKLLALGVAAGRTAPDKCRLLFNWIKAHFEQTNQWGENMMNRIALSMQLEFGYKVPLKLFGN